MLPAMHRIRRFCEVLACLALPLGPALSTAEETTREDILAAMETATRFMSEEVALHGGHVWVVSEDLAQRWGEVPARPSQIWLQGGTERVGQLMLDAWLATGDDLYLDAARKAADALIYGQHPLGGWHYFIDFDPTGVPAWYENVASRFLFGMEEYRYFYGNATFDDRVTQDAARFLLRFYNLTKEAAYREPVKLALDFVLDSQFANGAWPQRYPLRDDYAHDGFPDYTSYYTLNDGAAQANVELLFDAWQSLGNPRYYEAAARGVDAFIALQGPEGQGCWGEQHGPDLQPIAARTHEPPGYVIRESIGVMTVMIRLYLMTGDRKYLESIPRCLDWFDRINRDSAQQKYPRPRYWEPGTNRPLYVVQTDKRTPQGYGVFLWTSDPSKTDCDGAPCKGDGAPFVDAAYFREQFEIISNLTTADERAAYLAKMLASAARRQPIEETTSQVIASLDDRGAWITDDNFVNEPNLDTGADIRRRVRGISTGVFVDRMSVLIAALDNKENDK
jgi:PelA/Pel-15E family pectate lyase